ncbi:MAG: acyloxyacyl hydrolase [Thermodesulfobacteriota bacterium]
MRRHPSAPTCLLIAAALLLLCAGAARAGERDGVQEYGFTTGFGQSERENVQVIPLYGHVGWFLWDAVDEPLARHHLDLKIVVEGWVAGVHDPQDAVEFGINPVTFKLSYDRGQTVVPYFHGGAGVMYTGLGGIGLGGPFEFDEVVGVGFDVFVERGLALSLGYRFRHVSNADISSENFGLDTHFVLIGLDWLPKR